MIWIEFTIFPCVCDHCLHATGHVLVWLGITQTNLENARPLPSTTDPFIINLAC
jgi:hypothetical protein